MHALVHCSHAQNFWAAAGEVFHLKLPRLHPRTWNRDILCDQMFTERERCQIITIMWSIWTSRNRWTHDKEAYDPVVSMKKAKETLALLEVPVKQMAIRDGQCWRPPDPGWVKINTDGDVSAQELKGGGGGVARSHTAFLGAWSKPYDGVTDPLIMEALSLRDGVIFARLRSFSHLVIETDCLEVVDLWTSRYNSRSVVAPILEEIGDMLTVQDTEGLALHRAKIYRYQPARQQLLIAQPKYQMVYRFLKLKQSQLPV
uniref:Uncharacterized protein n=1 Tax=Avena sativa TaxID=4498 RepID=A0ACD5XZE4_AVESA